MNKFKITFVFLSSVLLLLGCNNTPWSKPKKSAGQPPKNAVIVAKVGSFYVTSDDLNKEVEDFNSLAAAGGMAQSKIDTTAKKSEYLRNDLVRKYILYQEALDRGLDRNEKITKVLENAKMTLLVAELVREELDKIKVDESEIRDFYDKNKDSLREPEQRKVLEIVTPTEDEAKQVYIELLKGTDFASLAKQYSKGPTASKGGDLGFLSLEASAKKRIRFDKFYEVAFSPTLEAGGISSIFKGQDGNYYIIKVDSIRKSEAKPYSELHDSIKNWLTFEKQQKALKDLADKLAGETKIEIFEKNID